MMQWVNDVSPHGDMYTCHVAHTRVCLCLCERVCARVGACARVCAHIGACARVCARIGACARVCAHVCACVCTCGQVCAHVCACVISGLSILFRIFAKPT